MDAVKQLRGMSGKFFIIEDDEDGFPQPTVEVPESQYKELIKSTNTVYEFRYFQRKVLEIQLNYEDYFQCVKNHQEFLKSKKSNEVSLDLDIAYVDINRTFINFITSLKVFIEHYEARLKRKYGKNSSQVDKFKKVTHDYYDNLFAFRFFMRLRNYSIHKEFPIYHLGYVVDYDKQTSQPLKYELKPQFDKSKLLEFDEMKKKLGLDLGLMNLKFPVEPQMLQIQKIIKQLLPLILEIEPEYYRHAAELIIRHFNMSYSKREVYVGYVNVEKNGAVWNKTNLEIATAIFIRENLNKK